MDYCFALLLCLVALPLTTQVYPPDEAARYATDVASFTAAVFAGLRACLGAVFPLFAGG